jgi:lipid-binding SYLF domain-containing protein
MRIRLGLTLLVVATLALAPAHAATRQEQRVADATDVLDQLLRIPEQSIPPTLLARAYAVAVVPNVVKAGFGLGFRHGKGILVVRNADNSWSNPAFISLTGGSLGFQAGAQSTDIILVFKTRKGVEDITSGKFTLGADAAVAAGPVGRSTSAATDIQFKAEVYSYSRNRGLFAGVSLEGASVSMDRNSNAAFYGSSSMTPEQIFASSGNAAPAVANNFVQLLTAQTRRLPKQPGMETGIASSSASIGASDNRSVPSQPSVKTYGIADPDAGSVVADDSQDF